MNLVGFNLPEGKTKTTIVGILSTILIVFGGYSFDTITTAVESNRVLMVKVSELESKIQMLVQEKNKGERFTQQHGNNLVARIERLELRVDNLVHHDLKRE